MNENAEGRSLPRLISDLADEVPSLVREEIALARAEVSEGAERMGIGAGWIFGSGLIALCALLVLVQALVLALSKVMAAWLASILVGVVLALVAWLLIAQGRKDLKPGILVPKRTISEVKEDARMVREKV